MGGGPDDALLYDQCQNVTDALGCISRYPCCEWNNFTCANATENLPLLAAESDLGACVPYSWVVNPLTALLCIWGVGFGIMFTPILSLYLLERKRHRKLRVIDEEFQVVAALEDLSIEIFAKAGDQVLNATELVTHASNRATDFGTDAVGGALTMLGSQVAAAGDLVAHSVPLEEVGLSGVGEQVKNVGSRVQQVGKGTAANAEASEVALSTMRLELQETCLQVMQSNICVFRPLLGVVVARLAADIDSGMSASDVLTELYTGCKYLEPCTTDTAAEPGSQDRKVTRGRLAIISYRCVPSKDDIFTLDAAAFVSILRAAQLHKIDYLWLDCWAYRDQPPWGDAYVHYDFVRTLATVMAQVDLVIWLPRSRAEAPGEYQERIWCSFEAAMVQLRKLPVVAAGYDMDKRQRSIAALGSLSAVAPWKRSSSPGRALGQLNWAFYFTIPCTAARWAIPSLYGSGNVVEQAYNFAMFIVWLTFWTLFWIAMRSSQQYAPTVTGRSHGNEVLNIMYSAARGARAPAGMLVRRLEQRLPWLKGYDRRDVMTVAMILHRFANRKTDGLQSAADTSMDALACSTFWHTRQQKSTGDDPTGLTLREWLNKIDIQLQRGGKLDNVLSDNRNMAHRQVILKAQWIDTMPLLQTEAAKAEALAEDAKAAACVKVSATARTIKKQPSTADLFVARSEVATSGTSAGTAPEMSEVEHTRKHRPPEDELWLRELIAFNWCFARGLKWAICDTPAGAFFARKIVSFAEVHHGQARWFWDISVVSPIPDFTSAPIGLGIMLSLGMLDLLRGLFVTMFVNYTVSGFVNTFIVFLIVDEMVVSCTLIAFFSAKWKWNYMLLRKGHVPPCLRISGKLEYAFFCCLLLTQMWYGSQFANALVHDSKGNSPLSGVALFALARTGLVLRRTVVVLSFGSEALLAAAHAVGGVLAYQSITGCFEIMANRHEAKSAAMR